MPRKLRLDPAHGRHHVMNRGARRAPIFLTDADCTAFLDLLAETSRRFALRVHAYALMGNHFHLLVTSPRGNLSKAMSFLQSRFSNHQNRTHGWDGPLFRGRFLNRLVTDDRYWRHLLAYVHLNPVAAQLVSDPELANWTSHRAYLGLERAPDWLDIGELLDLFGGPTGLRDYIYAARVGREPGPVGFDPKRMWTPHPSLPIPQAIAPPPDLERGLAQVSAATGLSVEEIQATVRGPRGNRAKLLAMWWLHEGVGLGTNAIARFFHVAPSAVSRTLREVHSTQEPTLEAWKTTLRSAVE